MLIWVASYPRSGNRLIRTALSSGWAIPSHTVFDTNERARRLGIPRRRRPAADRRIRDFRGSEGPELLKTHLLAHAGSPDPALVLVRDGRDAVVSFARFLAAGQGDPEWLSALRFEDVLLWVIEQRGDPFGGWSESVRVWTQRSAPVSVVRYEELRADPQGVARRALARLGTELGEPRRPMPSLEQMRSANPAIVGPGRVGGWREQMSARALERFGELHGDALVELGYERSADPGDWDGVEIGGHRIQGAMTDSLERERE